MAASCFYRDAAERHAKRDQSGKIIPFSFADKEKLFFFVWLI
jgi:hypothetical protein